MKRVLFGLRAARPTALRVAVAAAGVVCLAACAPSDPSNKSFQEPAAGVAVTTAPATTAAPSSPPPPTISAAPPTATRTTAAPKPKPKPKPKPRPVAKPAPKPAPTKAAPPPSACDPSYPDDCLKDGIGDYDCSSGSGNGPNYVAGPVRVVGSDPFGLDADGDGVGCEKG